VQLAFAGTVTGGRSIAAGDPVLGSSPVTTSPIPPPFTGTGGTSGMPFNVNLGAGAPTSGLFLGHRSPNFAVDLFISAAESKGVGKLLSKPRIMTQNNEKAVIKQGQKIPIQTTINNTISIQFIDAVLKLEVTPQITKDGTVFMDVLVENTQIDQGIARIQGVPALDTQSEETKVLVDDGGTVVVGGIIVSTQNLTTTEVPLLGSLPLIGHLFKRNNVNISSQELLFFLTPRIIPG
jgi:type IV pilus assembly protein PilQ